MGATRPKVVGIVGAAIGGPTLAIQILSHPTLKRAFRPILIDQAPAPGLENGKHRAGATVSLFANGLYPLYQLGLRGAIEKYGYEYDALSTWRGSLDGSYRQISRMPNAMWSNDLQTGVRYFERHALQGLLLDKMRELGGQDVSWGKKATGYQALGDGKTRIRFADGGVLDVDLLVGADGGYSTVRRFILDQRDLTTAEERWMPDSMGITCFYGVSEGRKGNHPICDFSDAHGIWLDRGVLSTGPLLNGRIRWDLILPEEDASSPAIQNERASKPTTESWQSSIAPSQYPLASTVEILQRHSNVSHPYAGNLEALLTSADRIIRSPLRQRVWKPDEIQWGNAVVVGDASRLMLPTSGQGSGFAVEDATMLANQLVRYASSPVSGDAELRRALEEYARSRQSRSRLMAYTAATVAKMGMGGSFYWRMIRNMSGWVAPNPLSKDAKRKDPWPMDGRFDIDID
ncbi:hypothetical protein PT974_06461 [Cladobotryum mycophilum]|uniref:FAD-binding domain-containing protein n=1 Tax=Cladobotryum mycophilum TaxID=491253 RepID=A0ABR0SLW7_9HYPO